MRKSLKDLKSISKSEFKGKIIEIARQRIKIRRKETVESLRIGEYKNVALQILHDCVFSTPHISDEKSYVCVVEERSQPLLESGHYTLFSSPVSDKSATKVESDEQTDEDELIRLLGIDGYHDIMCRIEDEIKAELNEARDIRENFYNEEEGYYDDEFSEGQIICPECRWTS